MKADNPKESGAALARSAAAGGKTTRCPRCAGSGLIAAKDVTARPRHRQIHDWWLAQGMPATSVVAAEFGVSIERIRQILMVFPEWEGARARDSARKHAVREKPIVAYLQEHPGLTCRAVTLALHSSYKTVKAAAESCGYVFAKRTRTEKPKKSEQPSWSIPLPEHPRSRKRSWSRKRGIVIS